MAAGSRLAATGAGLLAPIGLVPGTPLRWWRGSEARTLALASALVSAADLAGARLVLVSHSFRGTALAGVISGTSISAIPALPISTTSRITITTTGTPADSTAG